MINTSTINAINKSSMKPLSGATANRHLCSSGERNGEQRRTKVSFGCEHWTCSGWRKCTSRDEATLNSEPIDLVVELRLSEGISQSISTKI